MPKQANLDVLVNKRKWENEKRGTLISAGASRLYQTSNKINSEIDKRLNNNENLQKQNNNRESLQSRLLERIITKKQKSPEEIYLEEELSSEYDDETNKNIEEETEEEFENRATERQKQSNEDYGSEADIEDGEELIDKTN